MKPHIPFILLSALFVLPAANAQPISYYVSSSGSDSNPGTLALPFRTIEKARDMVRTVDTNMQDNISVYLREGTYELQSTLAFDQRDSGTNGFYVIYRNYPGEVPIISGGRQITGWVQEGDKWKAYVGTSLQTRQLYVNGNRAVRARSTGGLPGAVKTSTGYTTTDANMQNWGNIQDIEFAGKTGWKLFRCGVQSISGTTITMKQPCWSDSQAHAGWRMNNPDWIENAYELLDSPGEWYLNRQTGWIYYKPRMVPENGLEENMSMSTVIAPVVETLVSGTGTPDSPIHNMQFQGITFAYATWLRPSTNEGFPELQANVLWGGTLTPGNIAFSNTNSIVFERDIFAHLGAIGLEFVGGSKNNTVSGSQFFDISGSGMQFSGFDPHVADNSLSSGNRITDNYIHDIAVEYQGGVGIFLGYEKGSTIIHNELFNLPYGGIDIGWGWGGSDPSVAKDNKVQGNLIHDHMRILMDGGGIYSLSAQPGNIYSGNVIEGQVNEYGALYLDDGSRYITMYDNVVYNDKRSAIIKGGDHSIHDNWWQDKYFNDIWVLNPGVCGPNACGPSTIQNNHNITSLSEAPSALIQNAGLEAAYQDIKSLSPPVNLQSACASGGHAVNVSWNGVPGAASYLLRIDDRSNNGPGANDWYKTGSADLMTETSATIYIQGIDCGKDYSWWVHGKNLLGYGNAASGTFNCPCETSPPPAADASCPAGQAFRDVQSLGVATPNESSIESTSDGTLVIVIRGMNDSIWAAEWRDGALTKPFYMPGGRTQNRIKLVKTGTELWAYVIGISGNVYKNLYQGPGSWSGWTVTSIPSSQFGSAGPSSVTTASGTYKVTGLNPVVLQSCKSTACDLNQDGNVDPADFSSLKSSWGSASKPPADINQDGMVNSVDFGIMMSGWTG